MTNLTLFKVGDFHSKSGFGKAKIRKIINEEGGDKNSENFKSFGGGGGEGERAKGKGK